MNEKIFNAVKKGFVEIIGRGADEIDPKDVIGRYMDELDLVELIMVVEDTLEQGIGIDGVTYEMLKMDVESFVNLLEANLE